MEFVGKIAEKVIESKFGAHENQQQQEYVQQSEYGYGPPPLPDAPGGAELPYPWVARWDERDQRYFYMNEQTGETSWERPGGMPYGQPPAPYGQPGYGYGYGEERRGEYYEEQEKPKKDHSLAYGAAGAAAGVIGGAVLAHEGEEMCTSFSFFPFLF